MYYHRDKVICQNYLIMNCVKLFLEPKEKEEINKFSSEFQATPTSDDKVWYDMLLLWLWLNITAIQYGTLYVDIIDR